MEVALNQASPIALLRTLSLSGAIQQEIEKMILGGELSAGQRLNENGLAARLGVSRGPIREACRALAEMGLVQLVPNRGVFIRELSRPEVEEVYDVRAGLFGLAGSLLARKVTKDQIADLFGLVAEMDDAAAALDFERYYPLNLEFHDCIVRSTENTRLTKTYRGLIKELHLFRARGLVQGGGLAVSNEEHRRIVEALASGEPRRAYDAMNRHVANGKQRMLAAIAGADAVAEEETRPRARMKA